MSTALYRRYRPDSFAEMIGQEHVTQPLMQALRSNRVNHAYLFSGPRGCGKTTSARILARILNCAQNTEANPTDTPCGECPSCIELARGGSGSLDVVEIDAASHGGVDDARDLRERATFSPTRDRFKIFILDEAHMVTAQGFNALLKIVEEPPAYLKFIFATTEPEKVIGTIRSRTHHYPFKLVAPEVMHQYLMQLCQAEAIDAAPGVLQLVVRAGGGSVRDTLSVLDQLIAGASGSQLTYDHAVGLLGFTPATLLDDVVEGLAARDGAALFKVVEQVVSTGHEPRRFVEDVLERLRDLIVVALSGERAAAVLSAIPADQFARMQVQAGTLGAAELSRSADVVNAALSEMSGATSPRLHLELLCARLLLPAADASASGLGARIDGIERAISQGTAIPMRASGPSGVAENASDAASANQGPQGAVHSVAPTGSGVPVAGTQGSGERKSLRPDSTRRKPQSEPERNAGPEQSEVPANNNGSQPGHNASQAGPTHGSVRLGSMFGAPTPASSKSDAPLPTGTANLPVTTGWHTFDPTGGSSNQSATDSAAAHKESAPQVVEPAANVAPQGTGPQTAVQQPVTQEAAASQAAGQQSAALQPESKTTPDEQPQSQAQLGSGPDQTATFVLRWPEVLDAFAAKHRAAGAFAKQFAQVEHLDATTLYVSLANPNLVTNLTSRGGEQGIADAVQETLGFSVAVVIDVQGSDRFPKAGSSVGHAGAAPIATEQYGIQPAPTTGGRAIAQEGSQTTAVSAGSPQNESLTVPATPQTGSGRPVAAAPEVPLSDHQESEYFDAEAPEEDHFGESLPQDIGDWSRPDDGDQVEHGVPVESQSQTDSAQSQPMQSQPVHSEPAFDPLASVNVFGAAIGALATARHIDTPELPSLGHVTSELTEQWRAPSFDSPSAVQPGQAPLSQPEVSDQPTNPWQNGAPVATPVHESSTTNVPNESTWYANSVASAGSPHEVGAITAAEPFAGNGHQETVQPAVPHAGATSQQAHTPQAAQTHATTDYTHSANASNARAHMANTAGSAPEIGSASVPPWEETPRQAAARVAKEKMAQQAQRAAIMDDPQPDDEDFDSSNLVGIPLVMKMFGATIIDERTIEA